jgi:hypothetical protein
VRPQAPALQQPFRRGGKQEDALQDDPVPFCNTRFGEAGTMRQHITTIHEKVRAHVCPYCEGLAVRAEEQFD